MCMQNVCKIYTACIQNVDHISTSFGIYFLYKIKRTMSAKFCIENVYKRLLKCVIYTFCIHFV